MNNEITHEIAIVLLDKGGGIRRCGWRIYGQFINPSTFGFSLYKGRQIKKWGVGVVALVQRSWITQRSSGTKTKREKNHNNIMGRWCSGNMTVFGTAVGGSIPSRPAIR